MLRLDRAAARTIAIRLDRVSEGAAGLLLVDGVAARVGVLEYAGSDNGGARAEYVAPEVLFSADSLASMLAAPVTLGHPAQGVTPETWRRHAVGHVVDVIPDEAQGLLRVKVAIADAAAQQAIRDGLRELSCGYTAEYVPEPGVTESGARFDGRQLSRTYNHLAIVDQARAGRVARLYVDGASNMKIKIKDKEYTAPGWLQASIDAVASQRHDEIVTGEVMVNGTKMILPQAMIDQILAMLGAAPAMEAPEEMPDQPDALPEGETDPAKAALPSEGAPPAAMPEEKSDARIKQIQRERVIADALRAGVLPADYDVARHSTAKIMSDVIAAIDPTEASNKTTVDAATRDDAMSLGLIEGTFRAALRFRRDGVPTVRVDTKASQITVTHSIGEQIAQHR